MRFSSDEAAGVALRALAPDGELHPEVVSREMRVAECQLVVDFTSSDPKMLRQSMNSFFDMVALVDRVQHEFPEKRPVNKGEIPIERLEA